MDLDGQIFVVDPEGRHWVKFKVTKVDPSPEKPHGLDYSLTLHDETGHRLVDFDNAHSVRVGSGPGVKKRKKHDHKHQQRTVKPYEYSSAIKL